MFTWKLGGEPPKSYKKTNKHYKTLTKFGGSHTIRGMKIWGGGLGEKKKGFIERRRGDGGISGWKLLKCVKLSKSIK